MREPLFRRIFSLFAAPTHSNGVSGESNQQGQTEILCADLVYLLASVYLSPDPFDQIQLARSVARSLSLNQAPELDSATEPIGILAQKFKF